MPIGQFIDEYASDRGPGDVHDLDATDDSDADEHHGHDPLHDHNAVHDHSALRDHSALHDHSADDVRHDHDGGSPA